MRRSSFHKIVGALSLNLSVGKQCMYVCSVDQNGIALLWCKLCCCCAACPDFFRNLLCLEIRANGCRTPLSVVRLVLDEVDRYKCIECFSIYFCILLFDIVCVFVSRIHPVFEPHMPMLRSISLL